MIVKEYKILATDSSGTQWFVRWEELDCDFDFCDEFYLVPITDPAQAGSYSNREDIEKELAALREYGICWLNTGRGTSALKEMELRRVANLDLRIVELTTEV